MNPIILVDAQLPKTLTNIECVDTQRQFDKDIKQYVIQVSKSMKFKQFDYNYITLQLKGPQAAFIFTIETVQKTRVRVQFSPQFAFSSAKNLFKFPFLLPDQFVQLQFHIPSLCEQFSKLKEFEFGNCQLLKVFLSNEIYKPTIFFNKVYQQDNFSQLQKLQIPVIKMNSVLVDRSVLIQLSKQKPVLYNYQDYLTQFKIESDQTLQELTNAQLLQIQLFTAKEEVKETDQIQQITKSQIKPETKVKKEVTKTVKQPQKPYKSLQDFEQNSQSEHSNDYDIENIPLEFQQFEITYGENFKEEEGKDGQNVKLLTPVKVKGSKMKRQKLIGVKMNKIVETQINYEDFKVEDIENVQPEQVPNEISDFEDSELDDMIKNEMNLEDQKQDVNDLDEFLERGDTEIKSYMIDKLNAKQKAQLKSGILCGCYTLQKQSDGLRLGLVWDRIQNAFFEMEDDDDDE
ncbi:Hypothetical_protein [Hexamita inflata]|uniref:Hypothetical_protein n=1 Tax=Hexamita inflata TaxID=28002 RepID=A0AA86Q310_9EUKA|nr:Hypothetical protein HINF_LOCUS37948 [Hexamita inflata]